MEPTRDASLEAFLEATCTESHLRVEADLGDGFVRLRSDEAERRQAAQDIRSVESAIIELLRNSRDAHAHNIYVATAMSAETRTITVLDDGDGIPEHLHQLVFEPRVTSKLDTMHMDTWGVHGRGMALYSISMNAQEASVALSSPGAGTIIYVEMDTTSISEKSDQSTFPAFERTDAGTIALKGPKNIIRTVCEFALEQKSRTNVFLGSPAEIVAALFWNEQNGSVPSTQIFSEFEVGMPFVLKPSFAETPAELAEIASSMKLPLSERTARRIMDKDIAPADPLLLRIAQSLQTASKPPAKGSSRGNHSQRKAASATPHLSRSDLAAFGFRVSELYGELADQYYLDPTVEVVTRQTNGRLCIEIPLEPEQNA